MKIVNLEILKEPTNWLVVWTMLLVAFLLYEVIHRNAGTISVTDDNS
jgi:hypothetical protein